MSLLDVVRAGVKIADGITKPLQPTVSFWHFVSADGEGAKTYSPDLASTGVQLRAIVDYVSKQVRTQSGELTVSRATITLLNIAEVVAATGGDGIGNDDVFVLPDGDTGPLIDISGFIDAGTGNPIATTVMLG